jgi:hypothetical protein
LGDSTIQPITGSILKSVWIYFKLGEENGDGRSRDSGWEGLMGQSGIMSENEPGWKARSKPRSREPRKIVEWYMA